MKILTGRPGNKAAGADATKRKEPVAGLDVVRFCAALGVVIVHLVSEISNPLEIQSRIVDGHAAFPLLLPWARAGFIGVEIFFVLSGVVISYSAADSSAWRFLRSRVLRLYPAAWICALITTCTMWAFGLATGDYLKGRAAMLLGLFHSAILYPTRPWADPVYWTLGVEMAFYALVFILLAFGRNLIALAYAMGTASAAYWLLGWLYSPVFLARYLFDRTLDLCLIHYGIYFALGVMLYEIRFRGPTPTRIGFSVAMLPAAAIEIICKVGHRTGLDMFYRTALSMVSITIFLVALAAMVLSLWWRAPARLARTFRMIGIATYPLYLVHDQVGVVALRVLSDIGCGQFVALAGAIAIVIGASLVIAIKIEPPVRERVRRILDGLAARQQAAVSASAFRV